MQDRIYIRHGQSRYNIKETTDLDSELTDEGVLQARRVARWLKQNVPLIQFWYGVTTPYLRALQTARIIREHCGLNFEVHAGPREVMTCYDHVFIPNRYKIFPELGWQTCPEFWEFKRETADEYNERIRGYQSRQDWCQNRLTISHGTPIVSLVELDQGIKNPPNVTEFPRNCSVSRVENGKLICYDLLV
jgi:broad specificity phosphatase PhoE